MKFSQKLLCAALILAGTALAKADDAETAGATTNPEAKVATTNPENAAASNEAATTNPENSSTTNPEVAPTTNPESVATTDPQPSVEEKFAALWARVCDNISSDNANFAATEPAVRIYAEALYMRSCKWSRVSDEVRDDAVGKLALAYFLMRGANAQDGSFAFGEDPVEAVSAYDDIAEEFAATPFGAEALYLQSVLLTMLHQYEWAFDRVRSIIRAYPGSERVGDAIAQGYLIAESLRQGARPRKFKGRLPWLKDRKVALGFYDELHSFAPKSAIAPWLLFRKGVFAAEIADEWFESERRNDAINAFEMLITMHPESQLVPEAYLDVAASYEALCVGAEWDQVSARSALNYYTDFFTLFPDHEKAEFAYKKTEYLREIIAQNRISIGDFYYVRRNNTRAALVFYNEAITASPESETGRLAQERVDKILRGERAQLTFIDWLFGRYPQPATQDFSDAPSNVSLEQMGFQSATSPEFTSRGDSGGKSSTTAEEQEGFEDPGDH